jgi:Ca2+-transporting ATPase
MSAGIKIKIVTGDYKETAIMVAKKLGLEVSSENIMEAEELERISKEELKEKIDKIFLFTRITPHHKRKIVEVLKAKGEVVAMTGDGVNDSLALKEADIGIAVGEATEVAKEASDLVLLDSNFKTIILACEEGRLILSNIKKTIGYILSNSFLEIGIIFLAGILRWPPPLSLVQILYLHLICDGPPDLMFAFEPKEKGLMKKKPYDLKREPIFDKLLLALICLITIFVTLLSLFIFWHFGIKKNDLILGQTLVFVILGSVDLIYAISFKNLKKPIWKMEHFFKNKFLFLGITYGFLLLLWAIYLPSLSKVLNTNPLSGKYWVLALGAGILTTSILELAKGIFRIKNNNTV